MAKNNINLGTLQGKLGDNVFYRALGQQRVRAYFKREQYAVNQQQADYRARYSNLKAIWKWLPDPWKRACRTYRAGQTAFSSFMGQYINFTQPKDKFSTDTGRFLPVSAQLSKGTLGVTLNTHINELERGDSYDPGKGIGLRFSDAIDGIAAVKDYSSVFLQEYQGAKEGDILHFFLAWMQWDEGTWGDVYAAEGFPFPYNNSIYAKMVIDTEDTTLLDNVSPTALYGTNWITDSILDAGFYPKTFGNGNYYASTMAFVGAILLERTSANRQQRFSSSVLQFDRSQMAILNATGKNVYNTFSVNSYMHQPI